MPIAIRDDILQSVEKPARYAGGEWNSITKDHSSVDVRFAFCFPDTYEIGMSHLGMKILYHMINERRDAVCERVFAPWTDMEQKMRENDIPLFSLETREPVKSFDFIGFTLQYEMSYTNILNMLDLAGVPLLSADRGEDIPLVCAGGPCAYNPEPLVDFIDFFMMGEGEEILHEVLDAWLESKKRKESKTDFLKTIAKIQGIYVPAFYQDEYNADGTLKGVTPVDPAFPAKIKKRIIRDLDSTFFPDKVIVPYTAIIHDRIMLELFRGCTRGCRFCQAGYVYRPVRERTPERLEAMARSLENSTGYEEISLTSLSTSDYSGLPELTTDLIAEMEPKKVNLALPSLRVDSFSLDLMEKAQKVRKSGLTFAPEAGTQRLRDVINKGVTEEDLISSCSLAFRGGWTGVKLYFMIGLPTETMEDVEGITALGRKVVGEYQRTPRELKGKGLEVSISASSFVPKPFTPFQWEAQDTIPMLKEKQRFLKSNIRDRQMKFSWHDPEISLLEAVFARGDRRTGKVLLRAWERGCRFDSWGEHFRYDAWMGAFEDCGIDPAFYANRRREFTEVFPWDHIDIGVSKKYLMKENEQAYQEAITPNCMQECRGCGATSFSSGICMEMTGQTMMQPEKAASASSTGTVNAGDKLPDNGAQLPDAGTQPMNTAAVRAGSLRIRFTRGEEVKFISHLDLMKAFERAIRRSGLPISYSQGYNPHPHMVFGLPLSVGVTSDGEYADFDLAQVMEPGQFMNGLNQALPEGIRVTGATVKTSKTNIMAAIAAADYLLEIYTSGPVSRETAEAALSKLLGMNSVHVLKEGKNSVKDIDIRPLIISAAIEPLEGRPSGYEQYPSAYLVKASFRAGNTANLRPELFVKALAEVSGIPVAVSRLHRKALYVESEGCLKDPLDQATIG